MALEPNRYQHKRKEVAGEVPLAPDFLDGEIIANTVDGRLFTRKGAGVATIPNSGDNDARYPQIGSPMLRGVGTIVPVLGTSAEAGTLKLNGALISRATYADLYAWAVAGGLIATEANWAANMWGIFGAGNGSTTFRLPDWRGEFVRGWDDGRGVDPARAFGRSQADAFKSHNHSPQPATLMWMDPGGSIASPGGGPQIGSPGWGGGDTGGTETRPRNITALWCIRF